MYAVAAAANENLPIGHASHPPESPLLTPKYPAAHTLHSPELGVEAMDAMPYSYFKLASTSNIFLFHCFLSMNSINLSTVSRFEEQILALTEKYRETLLEY
jgi:hypothetical protein